MFADQFDLTLPFFWTHAAVLTESECADLVSRMDAMSPAVATINTALGVELNEGIRNNERVIFDDQALADDLFSRLRSELPQSFKGANLVGLNERFRGYKYSPGQYFRPHRDGAFRRGDHEWSELTALFFLNEVEEGGDTVLWDIRERVSPAPGLCLVFQHRLLHEGAAVMQGMKYVLRSDVMFSDRPGDRGVQ